MTAVLTSPPREDARAPLTQRHRASVRRRLAMVILALGIIVLALFVAALSLGSAGLSPAQVIGGVFGQGKQATVFVVQELRLPRGMAAVLIGAALGISGTLFQRVLGNPLASPDFLGVAAGASTATVTAIVLGGVAGLTLPMYALIGGAVTAALIYLFAWKQGVSEYRFILIGIGVSAFASSITSYLLARAEFSDARAAITWLVGSVGQASTEMSVLVAGALLLFALFAPVIARLLRALELGDETASVLGARVERDRFIVLGTGVALVSLATAATGPIAFVAMLAGPLSSILLGSAGRSILATALMGSVLMQVSDLIAQHALPWPISTGVVTGLFGAPYIVWVLISSARKASNG